MYIDIYIYIIFVCYCLLVGGGGGGWWWWVMVVGGEWCCKHNYNHINIYKTNTWIFTG